ncbi:MAG: EMC3/TMCO1 family protein [Candidatus Hermodarchaeota archaeon]
MLISEVFVVIQIIFITLGMIALGMVLNHFLGLTKESLQDMRKRALNFQERMKNAQLMGDYQQMAQIQQESAQFMKVMMKKQMIPLCLRCIIFIGIFMVLGLIYADYESGLLPFPLLIFGSGWVAIYLIFSVLFSFFIWGVKRLTGMGGKTQTEMREIMGIVSPQQGVGLSSYVSSNASDEPRKDAWKDRIEE